MNYRTLENNYCNAATGLLLCELRMWTMFFLSSILHVLNYMIICRCFLCFYISGCDCSVFLVCLPWTKNLIVYASPFKDNFLQFFLRPVTAMFIYDVKLLLKLYVYFVYADCVFPMYWFPSVLLLANASPLSNFGGTCAVKDLYDLLRYCLY